ncbi:class I SAM-dependent methyltransferase [Melioribacter sp. OK-6-Me]|uniref:class I SAM-dependent methyltransferase n=1 Tax=unclassified Melioribacter TaxID=2627329 RepID=UPI003ED8625F
MIDLNSIPKSENDLLLNEWGFDLIKEYFELIQSADFPSGNIILDVATGTGRALSILTRLGYSIITGDNNHKFKSESEKRISENFRHKVHYIKLNLEKIPFRDNSIDNIVCINTLHELENLQLCLDEIIRVHSSNGKMLIADFNSAGFDAMDRSYRIRYNKLHTRGKITPEETELILLQNYSNVIRINTKLNYGFIVHQKLNAG